MLKYAKRYVAISIYVSNFRSEPSRVYVTQRELKLTRNVTTHIIITRKKIGRNRWYLEKKTVNVRDELIERETSKRMCW